MTNSCKCLDENQISIYMPIISRSMRTERSACAIIHILCFGNVAI